MIPARGVIHIGGREHQVDGRAFIDENAGYHARRMTWRWSAGVGADTGGRRIAWNAVVGYNDTPPNSENTVWVDDVAQEIGAVRFADDLSSAAFSEGDSIHFHQEAMRARRDDLLLIRSDYAQPIGTFTGTLPFGIRLREAYGVMERHEALW